VFHHQALERVELIPGWGAGALVIARSPAGRRGCVPRPNRIPNPIELGLLFAQIVVGYLIVKAGEVPEELDPYTFGQRSIV
jgi:hypothetical protein